MNFITCSHCQAKDPNCPVCHGLRVVLTLDDKIIYWQKNLSTAFIYNQKFLKTLRKIIDALLYIFTIATLIVIIYFIYQYLSAGGKFIDFFLSKHWLLNLFWLACLVGLYIFYRMSSFKAAQDKVVTKPQEKITIDFEEGEIWRKRTKLERINSSLAFNLNLLDIINSSYLLSCKLNQELRLEHILYKLIEESKEVKGYFFRLGVNISSLKKRLENIFQKTKSETTGQLSVDSIKLFLFAYEEAYNNGQKIVSQEEVLIALARVKGVVQDLLYDLEIDETKLRNMVEWGRMQQKIAKYWRGLRSRAKTKPKGEVNRAYTAVASPFLDNFSQDLTQLGRAGYLEPAVGKEKEIKSIFSYFNAGRSGVVIVGQPGSGKSFVTESLAQLMAAEEVPKILQDKRLVRLSVPAVIAGADAPGAIEARLLQILKEVRRAGNIILVVDNIDAMVGLGTETSESLDLAEVLASELNKDYFLLVAISDKKKYDKYLKQTSLGQRLSIVEVDEPERNQAIRILQAKAPFLESRYNVVITYQALETAVDFSVKYIHNQFLPQKAIELLERTTQSVKEQGVNKAVVVAQDVAAVVSKITKIPVTKVTEIESKKLLNLEQEMHQRVVDQEEGVKSIAQAMRRARANLRQGKRPIASFLFLGPTGVGKTEVARTLSEIYFGGEENMIRVDMSEYGALDAIPKMIGSGKRQGYLTSKVKEKPFALVLLDEFEKAELDVQNLFLQVMEDGRLTDASGETVDFTNAIIIGTSNAGTDIIQKDLKKGKNINDIKKELIENHLSKHFKPELINRFDGVIVFKPLSMNEVKQITVLMLNKLKNNLAEKGMEFLYTDEAVTQVAELGFDPSFGARPLRRVIQDKIENEIANLILAGQAVRRDKIILNKVGDIKIEKAVRI